MHWKYHTIKATLFCLFSNYVLGRWKLSQTRPLTIDSFVNNNYHYCPQLVAKSGILVQYGCPRIPATCHRHMVSPQNFISFSLVRVLLIPTSRHRYTSWQVHCVQVTSLYPCIGPQIWAFLLANLLNQCIVNGYTDYSIETAIFLFHSPLQHRGVI